MRELTAVNQTNLGKRKNHLNGIEELLVQTNGPESKEEIRHAGACCVGLTWLSRERGN
jgi:hypothetical protein